MSGVRVALKDFSMGVEEFGPVEIHRAKDLLRVALTGCGDQRLVSPPRPSLVEGRILPEAGFVPEEQGRLAFSGFFLAWDRCIAASGLARPDPL